MIIMQQPVYSPRYYSELRIFILCLLSMFCAAQAWAEETKNLEVEVTGIKAELLKNVDVFMSIAVAAKQQEVGLLDSIIPGEEEKKPPALTERMIQRLHRKAPEEIRQALQPYGYYEPDITSSLEKLNGIWQAKYQIDRGAPTRLGKVEISVTGVGAEEMAVKDALASIELVPGKRLRHSKYEAAKSLLSDTMYNSGYIDAKFTQSQLRVTPETRTADIFLVMETGPPYEFGEVNIEQGILKPEFVNRFVEIKEGQRFSADELIGLQLALNDSEYFDIVEIQAERKNAVANRIPVTVKTSPSKPRRYTAGLGFGTDTGPRATAGVEFRRVNRRGHKFRTDIRVSAIEQTLSSQYIIPFKNVTTDNITFSASATREEDGDADTNRFVIGPSINDNWLGFRRRLYLSAERENFDFGDGTQTSTLLIPGAQLSRKYADDPLFARKGYRATLDVHGGIESPFTETTFLQASLLTKGVVPFTDKGRLLIRGELGATGATTFFDLPPSQRFFAGGDQSVRGYDYQDLGPENNDGDVVGGKYLTVASIEADYLFYGNFGAAMFLDAGNTSNELPPSLKKGVGLGLRYRSPIGMIRLDVAHPLDDPDNDFRLHISLGPDL